MRKGGWETGSGKGWYPMSFPSVISSRLSSATGRSLGSDGMGSRVAQQNCDGGVASSALISFDMLS
jgi:hypothetical protein